MKPESKIKLEWAKTFFKFSFITSELFLGSNDKLITTDLAFSYLGHSITLKLDKSEEELGSRLLEHIGTYIMIQQLNKVLEDEYGFSRLQSNDIEIINLSQIVRLIRNAFAHDPFNPVWDISKSAENQEYQISGILSINTSNLHGKRLKREDYGGPIALLKLLEYAIDILSQSSK